MTEQTPGAGHNKPPETDPLEAFLAEANAQYEPYRLKLAEIVAGLQKANVTKIDENTEPVVTDFISQIRGVYKKVEKVRTAINAPLNLRKTRNQEIAKTLLESCKRYSDELESRMKVYLDARREAERKAKEAEEKARREEAERLAKEAEEKRLAAERAALEAKTQEEKIAAGSAIQDAEALAKQAEKTEKEADRAAKHVASGVAKGDYGGAGHLRTHIHPEIVNKAKIPFAVLGPYIDDEAILKACRAAHRDGMTEIAGIRFVTETKYTGKAAS